MSIGVFHDPGLGHRRDGIDEPRSQTQSSSILRRDLDHVSGVSLSTAKLAHRFAPDQHTARIGYQVVIAAIEDLVRASETQQEANAL